MILLSDKYWGIKNTRRKGRGLFAKRDIPKGTVIGDYTGKVIHPQDAMVDEENFYLMYYHDRAVISPDLKKPGIHLLNHSCSSNTFSYTYKGHTLVFSRRLILEGEEITASYLLAPKGSFCEPCPHICDCGDLKCTRTMHLSEEKYIKWRKFNDAQAKETKRQKIRFGKELPLLSSYPKRIPSKYIREVNGLFLFKPNVAYVNSGDNKKCPQNSL